MISNSKNCHVRSNRSYISKSPHACEWHIYKTGISPYYSSMLCCALQYHPFPQLFSFNELLYEEVNALPTSLNVLQPAHWSIRYIHPRRWNTHSDIAPTPKSRLATKHRVHRPPGSLGPLMNPAHECAIDELVRGVAGAAAPAACPVGCINSRRENRTGLARIPRRIGPRLYAENAAALSFRLQ